MKTKCEKKYGVTIEELFSLVKDEFISFIKEETDFYEKAMSDANLYNTERVKVGLVPFINHCIDKIYDEGNPPPGYEYYFNHMIISEGSYSIKKRIIKDLKDDINEMIIKDLPDNPGNYWYYYNPELEYNEYQEQNLFNFDKRDNKVNLNKTKINNVNPNTNRIRQIKK